MKRVKAGDGWGPRRITVVATLPDKDGGKWRDTIAEYTYDFSDEPGLSVEDAQDRAEKAARRLLIRTLGFESYTDEEAFKEGGNDPNARCLECSFSGTREELWRHIRESGHGE